MAPGAASFPAVENNFLFFSPTHARKRKSQTRGVVMETDRRSRRAAGLAEGWVGEEWVKKTVMTSPLGTSTLYFRFDNF